MSINVKSILDKIKMDHENFTIDDKIVKFDECVHLNEYQIELIISVIKKFISDIDINFAEGVFSDIFKKPSIKENGKIYETLLYGWLIEHEISFKPQVEIKAEDCLKKNKYDADGQISNVIFDVKSFGFGFTHIDTFRNKLQNKLKNYIVTIEGSKNISAKDLDKYALCNIDKIANELQNDKNKIYTCYKYCIKELDLEIRAIPKEEMMAISISQFNPYEWAKNNQFFFIKSASQFCVSSPYIIFCPFDSDINHMMNNENDIQVMLRALCRRIFINLEHMNNRKVFEFDGKAKQEATIAIASRKISAIIFLDVVKYHSYEDCRTWVYVNPNADNPLFNYQIDQWFRQAGAFIDDFKYDNY